jgi:uncharacterized membrane protein YuzA (DUF378 family)
MIFFAGIAFRPFPRCGNRLKFNFIEEFVMATLDAQMTERRHIPDRRADAALHHLGALDWVAMVLLIIGGLNWGLMGLLNIDLIAAMFGEMTQAARAAYIVVGLSGLYAIYLCIRLSSRK